MVSRSRPSRISGDRGPQVALPCPNCGARIRLEVERLAEAADAAEPGAGKARPRWMRFASKRKLGLQRFWLRYFPPLPWR